MIVAKLKTLLACAGVLASLICQAQHYSISAVTNGQVHNSDGSITNYTIKSTGSGANQSVTVSGVANLNGQVQFAKLSGSTIFTFTYVDDGSGLPPPAVAVVDVSSLAEDVTTWEALTDGSLGDGYGNGVNQTSDFGLDYYLLQSVTNGPIIEQNPGQSFSISISPSAIENSDSIGLDVSMSTAVVIPQIAVQGTQVVNKADTLIEGQQLVASPQCGTVLNPNTLSYTESVTGFRPVTNYVFNQNAACNYTQLTGSFSPIGANTNIWFTNWSYDAPTITPNDHPLATIETDLTLSPPPGLINNNQLLILKHQIGVEPPVAPLSQPLKTIVTGNMGNLYVGSKPGDPGTDTYCVQIAYDQSGNLLYLPGAPPDPQFNYGIYIDAYVNDPANANLWSGGQIGQFEWIQTFTDSGYYLVGNTKKTFVQYSNEVYYDY